MPPAGARAPYALVVAVAAAPVPRTAVGDLIVPHPVTGGPLTVPTRAAPFHFQQVREHRREHPLYPNGVVQTGYLSPPIQLMKGEAWFSLPDVTVMPMPAPGQSYAILGGKFDIVDESGRSIPLSEMYSHHWLVYDKLVGGSGYNIGCGGEDTFVSNIFGAGGEMRGIDYTYPPGYGYVSKTGKEHWSANLHFIRTEDLSTERFNGSVGAAVKDCIECGYAPGKGLSCIPGLTGTGIFGCCFDGCRCSVNNKHDRARKTYFLQYNITWTTDVSRIQPVKQLLIDVLDCDICANLAPGFKGSATTCGDKVCTSSIEREMPWAGTIEWAYTHQHIGGLNSTLAVNGKEVCTSRMRWGTDPGNTPGNEKGYGVGAEMCIDSPTHPEQGVHVGKGDTLRVTSHYSIDPADNTSLPIPGGNRRGVMNLFVFYIIPDDAPAPTPTGLYRCQDGVCTAATNGVPWQTCADACS